jgi:hypothetical protein
VLVEFGVYSVMISAINAIIIISTTLFVFRMLKG